jgi:hypothetical protein
MFSEGINTDFVPFPARVPKKVFDKTVFYIDVPGEKKITRFSHSLPTAVMSVGAQEHFQSYKGNAGNPCRSKNPFQDGIFL